ncbi:hypothetical protein Q5O24_01520 [Eubacteriaceae bacterium ES3]|nr:hypothetical protein Q5O24_01520 [Eubacteriaceae bacterium ES3]
MSNFEAYNEIKVVFKEKKKKKKAPTRCLISKNGGLLVGYHHTPRRPPKKCLILELLMDIDKLIKYQLVSIWFDGY